MKNKKLWFSLLIVLISFGLCGCGITGSTAKKAAKGYIEGKFAIIVATYDSINSDKVEEYAARYSVQDAKSILRIEIIQYKDFIPELSFSSFSETNDSQYALDWYTISNGSVTHHEN